MVARQTMVAPASYSTPPRGARLDQISGNGVSTVPKDVAKFGPEKEIVARQRV